MEHRVSTRTLVPVRRDGAGPTATSFTDRVVRSKRYFTLSTPAADKTD